MPTREHPNSIFTDENFPNFSHQADPRFVWNGHLLRPLVVQPEVTVSQILLECYLNC